MLHTLLLAHTPTVLASFIIAPDMTGNSDLKLNPWDLISIYFRIHMLCGTSVQQLFVRWAVRCFRVASSLSLSTGQWFLSILEQVLLYRRSLHCIQWSAEYRREIPIETVDTFAKVIVRLYGLFKGHYWIIPSVSVKLRAKAQCSSNSAILVGKSTLNRNKPVKPVWPNSQIYITKVQDQWLRLRQDWGSSSWSQQTSIDVTYICWLSELHWALTWDLCFPSQHSSNIYT